MKKLQLLILLLVGVTTATLGQSQPIKQTAVIKTPTMQCDACKTLVENYLAHEDGILKVNADIRKKTVTVTYRSDRTNLNVIQTDIANCGFDADSVTAEPDSYKRLPPCCKKQ